MRNPRCLKRRHAAAIHQRPLTPPTLLHLPSTLIPRRRQPPPPRRRRLPPARQPHLGQRRLATQAHPVVAAAAAAVARRHLVVLGRGGRVQVDIEREHIGREDEGDDPLEHGARVVVAGKGARDEGDGEQDLDDDKGELDPEGEAEDAVFAVAWRYLMLG